MLILDTIAQYIQGHSIIWVLFLIFLRGIFVSVRNGDKISNCISMWIRFDISCNKKGKTLEGISEPRVTTHMGMPFYMSSKYYYMLYILFIIIIITTAGLIRNPFPD